MNNKVQTMPVQVDVHGQVRDEMREFAAAKAESVLQIASEPVLHARVALTKSADPAVDRPAVAQATIDMNGRTIRAQAAAENLRAAIEQMAARLRVRLEKSARDWSAQRGTLPTTLPHEWRHQSIPARRPGYFPRPAAERQVMRRGSYAAGALTVVEAAAELDLLDYDFHLFTERSTGQVSVIYRTSDEYRLAQAVPKPQRLGPLPAGISVSGPRAPRLTVTEAIGRLEAMHLPFVFFVNSETGNAGLVYHRYDGHYGLVGSDEAARDHARPALAALT